MRTLALRSRIPDVQVFLPDGNEVSLLTMAANKNTLLFFLRDAACVLTQAYLQELVKAAPQFAKRGLQLIAAVDAEPSVAAKILAPLQIPFTVLCNGSGMLYDCFGVGKATGRDTLGNESTMAAIRAAYTAGFAHGTDTGEPLRLPAWFLVDPSGEICKMHYGKFGNDLPSADTLLTLFEQIL